MQSTIKDINIALKTLTENEEIIYSKIKDINKELKSNKINVYLLGQYIESENDVYQSTAWFDDVESYWDFNKKYKDVDRIYFCFYLIKKKTTDVTFNKKFPFVAVFTIIKKETKKIFNSLMEKHLDNYFESKGDSYNIYFNKISNKTADKISAKISTKTADKTTSKTADKISNKKYEVNVYINLYKKEGIKIFSASDKKYLEPLDFEETEFDINRTTSSEISAKKMAKRYYNLLTKNKEVEYFLIKCFETNNKENPFIDYVEPDFSKATQAKLRKKLNEYLF